jgi:hypothetical protein
MHQHSFCSAGVEGRIPEPKRLSVADLELRAQPALRRAAARFNNHVFADIDANGPPPGSNEPGDLEGVVAQPASEIEDSFAAGQLQPGQDNRFEGNYVRQLIGFI